MPRDDYEPATEQSVADLRQAIELLDAFPTMFCATLDQAALTKAALERWAWMGNIEVDLMNRTGGPEMIRLAREINRIGKESGLTCSK